MKQQVSSDYFEKLIQVWLLDNTHASFVSVQPKIGLTGLMEEEEKCRLAQYKAALTQEEKEALVRETKELKRYQEEPTPAEALKCIPLLNREDMDKKAQPFQNEERQFDNLPVLFHDIFTNGIQYVRFAFDVKDLKEYAPYLSLLAELISAVDTQRYDKLELGNQIFLHSAVLARMSAYMPTVTETITVCSGN